MTFPLLKILPGVLKAAAKILGIGKLGEAADALANAQIPPEKLAELQVALLEAQKELRQLDVEELRVIMSEALAEIQSPDKFVSRARPTGLYLFYAVCTMLSVALIFGVKIDPTAVLTIVGPLGGVGGMYVYRRSTEKMNGNGTSE